MTKDIFKSQLFFIPNIKSIIVFMICINTFGNIILLSCYICSIWSKRDFNTLFFSTILRFPFDHIFFFSILFASFLTIKVMILLYYNQSNCINFFNWFFRSTYSFEFVLVCLNLNQEKKMWYDYK